MTYIRAERLRAQEWKAHSPSLTEPARAPGTYALPGKQTQPLPFCLPPEHAALSLLPDVRADAIALFADLGIPWHAGVGDGPSNHLLDSQVQCVNALGRMVTEPERLRRALGDLLGIEEVLEIEPGRYLTFEYIGPKDLFGEAPGGQRTRGSRCTSVDAAFLHRSVDGHIELVLLEWKYTELYTRGLEPTKLQTREKRYGRWLRDPEGPVRADVMSFAALTVEPVYQLVRQQLLAHGLELTQAHRADRVRVVHVAPTGNLAYQASLPHPEHQALGSSVSEVWQQLLRHPDRFVSVDASVFQDAEVTSREYVARYGDAVIASQAQLLSQTGARDGQALAWQLFPWLAGDVELSPDEVRVSAGSGSAALAYPFALSELFIACLRLEAGALVDQSGGRRDCPACGSRLVPVVYGLPDPDLMSAASRGEVLLGGCVVTPGQALSGCPVC